MKRTPLRRKKRMRRSRLSRKKDDPNSTYWRNMADLAWGAVVHSRAVQCAVNDSHCGGNLEAHHLLGRRPMVRHDPDLGICICSNHHKWSADCSPHGGPAGFFIWLERVRPNTMELIRRVTRGEYARKYPTFKDAAMALDGLA